MKVTVLVVDDEPIARAGLKAMLFGFDWIEVVFTMAAPGFRWGTAAWQR